MLKFNTNEEIKNYLSAAADVKYKAFSEKITPSEKGFLGVRIPALRNIAKEAAKGDAEGFLNLLTAETFEEKMLFGLCIGYAKLPMLRRVELIGEYLSFADSWSLIDCALSAYKFIGKDRESFLPVIEKYLEDKREFAVRFSLVALLDYYVSKEYLPFIFAACDKADCSYYYVSMAVAWLLSVCFVKFPEDTEKYLNLTKIDDSTFKRTVGKIRDSYRVDEPLKQKIRSMRK